MKFLFNYPTFHFTMWDCTENEVTQLRLQLIQTRGVFGVFYKKGVGNTYYIEVSLSPDCSFMREGATKKMLSKLRAAGRK